MRERWFESLSMLSFAAMALAFPAVAEADIVNLNEFAVVNNRTTIFDDSYNRTLSLVGGSGTSLSSGTTFADNGAAASYFVHGTIDETTANNGQAVLDTAKGFLVPLPDPFIPLTSNVEAFLQTGTTSSSPHLLSPAKTFSDVALFDLAVPATVLGTYEVALTTSTTGSPGRELVVRLRKLSTGPVLQFAWLDFADNLFTLIDQVTLTPAELADPQMELALSLNTAGSDVITGSFAFGSGNTLASFTGSLTALGSTNSSTDLFTAGKDFALGGFDNFVPVVPEPSTWAMMLIGFAGLGFLAWRGQKSAANAA